MAAKLTRLTHKTAIKLRLASESCNICCIRSRRPVQKIWSHPQLCILFCVCKILSEISEHNEFKVKGYKIP
jgi:hypothetical protein